MLWILVWVTETGLRISLLIWIKPFFKKVSCNVWTKFTLDSHPTRKPSVVDPDLIQCESWSSSSILGHRWFGSRFSITKFWKFYSKKKSKNCNLHFSLASTKGHPRHRRSFQSSKEHIQHFKTWNSFIFFSYCWWFLPSWTWIRIQPTNINADSCGSESTTLRKTLQVLFCIFK